MTGWSARSTCASSRCACRIPTCTISTASCFPITAKATLACTGLLTKEEIAALERVTEVVPVSVDDYSGICNSVRLPTTVLNSSHIHDLHAGTEDYRLELRKNRRLRRGGLVLGDDAFVDQFLGVQFAHRRMLRNRQPSLRFQVRR